MMKRMLSVSATVSCLALGILGCQSSAPVSYEKPMVSPVLPDFEEVTLFESKSVDSYFRKTIAIPSGDCEVALDVVAKIAAGAEGDQPSGWWQFLAIKAGDKLFTGCYDESKVTKTSKTHSKCYAKVPQGCDAVTLGFGRDKQSSAYFDIASTRLVMLRPTAHSLSPANDAEVADNTPKLTWKSKAKGLS